MRKCIVPCSTGGAADERGAVEIVVAYCIRPASRIHDYGATSAFQITADQADYRLTTGSTLSATEQPSSPFVVRNELTAAYPGAGLSAYPSAFSAVGSPVAVAAASSAAAAAAAAAAGQLCFGPMSPGLINHYGSLMCSPVLLDRLGPHILRSHISTAQFKPIPNSKSSLTGDRGAAVVYGGARQRTEHGGRQLELLFDRPSSCC